MQHRKVKWSSQSPLLPTVVTQVMFVFVNLLCGLPVACWLQVMCHCLHATCWALLSGRVNALPWPQVRSHGAIPCMHAYTTTMATICMLA